MKYYVVFKGRKPGVYKTWSECEKQVKGFSNAIYKSYPTLEEANLHWKNNSNDALRMIKLAKSTNPNNNSKEYKNIDNCLLCGRPFLQTRDKHRIKRNRAICLPCEHKRKQLEGHLHRITNGKIKWLSRNDLVFLKEKYQCNDIFNYLTENPYDAFTARCNINKNLAFNNLNVQRLSNQQITSDDQIPTYIQYLFDDSKKIIKLSGDMRNPQIFFHCSRCDQDFVTTYKKYMKHKGHDCKALISSGEAIVKDYLSSSNIKFLTQRETLKCINPDTGFVMPYDFEIPDKKIIIEVQGEQHRKFIEVFHVDEDGFEYQKKKDNIKREFAIANGYTFVELWYEDIYSGKYKKIINQYL